MSDTLPVQGMAELREISRSAGSVSVRHTTGSGTVSDTSPGQGMVIFRHTTKSVDSVRQTTRLENG